MYGFQSCGFDCKGLNITVFSEILPSAGFGITTAMKVATALALRALFNKEMTDVQMIQAVERGNTYFLNTGHYLADINTALYSEENTFLLTDHQKSTKTFLPFNFPEYSIVLTDARVPRISVWDEETIRTPENYLLMAELKNQKNGYWVYEESSVEINDILSCVNEDTRRRLICIMKEHKNVMDAADSLKNGNFNGFARAVNKSHEFMRDLYTISCPEIDWLVKRVLEFDMTSSRNPTACSRITGKGFGRCSYTMIKNTDVDEYFKKITEYERIFGFHPACYIVKPSGGAKIVYQ